MSYTDAVTRIGQIQDQITNLRAAFVPAAAQTTGSATAGSAATTSAASGGAAATSFSDALAGAISSNAMTATTATAATATATGGTALPTNATTMLTSDQQQFASRLASDTGLDPGVVSAWVLAEESGSAATTRQAAANNDWLNIGYTDSATYGSGDSVWSDPVAAADATAGWLRGQNTIAGYGTASSGIQSILATAGQPPATQIAALQSSGWASSGYPALTALYQQVSA